MSDTDIHSHAPGESPSVHAWRKFRSFLLTYGGATLATITAVLLATPGFLPLPAHVNISLYVLAVLFLCADLWLKIKTTRSFKALQQQRDDAREQLQCHADARTQLEHGLIQGLEVMLTDFLEHAQFAGDAQARASLYVHRGEHFELIARRSSNVELAQPGRQRIPLKVGVIADAWGSSEGCATKWNLPAQRESWLATLEGDGFSREEARGITMHARSLGAVRLSHSQQHIGVIVLEHERGSKISFKMVHAFTETEEYRHLSRFVHGLHAHLPGARSLIDRAPG